MSGLLTTEASELGSLVKEYALSRARVKQIILVIGISATLASFCWLPAIFEPNDSLTTRIGISIVGPFVASPVFVGVYQLFRLSGVSLSLYTNGLIYRRRGKEYMTTWNEIDSYLCENAVRITKQNGQVIEFGPSLEGLDEVAQEIQAQTLQRRLPQMKAALQNGSSVQFNGLKPFEHRLPGKALNHFSYASSGFSVDAQGLTDLDGGNRIAWRDVVDYGITQEKMGRWPVDVFFIQADQIRLQTRLGLLSNAYILLAPCAEMTHLETPLYQTECGDGYPDERNPQRQQRHKSRRGYR